MQFPLRTGQDLFDVTGTATISADQKCTLSALIGCAMVHAWQMGFVRALHANAEMSRADVMDGVKFALTHEESDVRDVIASIAALVDGRDDAAELRTEEHKRWFRVLVAVAPQGQQALVSAIIELAMHPADEDDDEGSDGSHGSEGSGAEAPSDGSGSDTDSDSDSASDYVGCHCDVCRVLHQVAATPFVPQSDVDHFIARILTQLGAS